MRKIIIKEGPLVFLRNVLSMEIIAFLFFYAISFLQNYEMLYRSLGLLRFMRYTVFLMIVFSTFQLIYISLLFLDWYFTHFEITEKEITKKSGLLFRRRRTVTLSNVVSVEIYNSPIDRIMTHATIILHHDTNRRTKMRNVLGADDYVHILKQMIHGSSGKAPTLKVSRLIEEGENRFVEFKETLRFDTRRNEISKEMERVIMKTIVAFLNADGGTILIGVNDGGEIVGLDNDYKTLPKKNRDGFENHLNMLVKTMIGMQFSKYISIKFEKIEDKEICIISVGESHKPAYLRVDQKEDFFVRVGNSTQPFLMSETTEYIGTHWKQ